MTKNSDFQHDARRIESRALLCDQIKSTRFLSHANTHTAARTKTRPERGLSRKRVLFHSQKSSLTTPPAS